LQNNSERDIEELRIRLNFSYAGFIEQLDELDRNRAVSLKFLDETVFDI